MLYYGVTDVAVHDSVPYLDVMPEKPDYPDQEAFSFDIQHESLCEFEVSEKGAKTGEGALRVRTESGILAFSEQMGRFSKRKVPTLENFTKVDAETIETHIANK